MALQSCPLPVLITRPHAQALRFAAQLMAVCGDAVAPLISPILAPAFLQPAMPAGRFGAIVLSSETGARAAAALRQAGVALPDLAFCVGDQTADVARSLGFVARSAAGDVHDLLALVIRRRADAPFLHLRGRETTGDLVADIRAAGIDAQAAIVYAQDALPLSQHAQTALAASGPVCVPLFSPRSARLFWSALADIPVRAPLHVVAISGAAARGAPSELVKSLSVADHPDAPAMVRAIADLCFKP